MTFKSYPKIHRLGKTEVENILCGHCYVQEKIDGANTSIWLEDGDIKIGSRKQMREDGFNGFREYVDGHNGIKQMLTENPDYRLYGEWLVRHTIPYRETAYKKFYLFDIFIGGDRITIDEVYNIANEYGIETPKLFGYIKNPTTELLNSFLGKSELGEQGEGIVIKNMDYINAFGRCVYAKLVTEKFKETNSIVFGGNNKHSDTYYEMYVVNKYITLSRVTKICNKLQPIIDEKLDMKHIPRIVNTVYNDMLTEEIWDIQKKVVSLNFKKLKRLALLKIKQIYCDILSEDISVADKKDE
jgi:hypothetical protein